MSVNERAPVSHVLRAFGDGSAVLLRSEDSGIFEVNASAALIWKWYLEGADEREIARRLAERYGLARDVAAHDVRAALTLEQSAVAAPDGPYGMHAIGDDYRFDYLGRPVLLSDAGATTLRLPDWMVRDEASVRQHLGALIPNLLALRGHAAMHGSAVADEDGSAIVLTGRSGAGKTTTARAWATAGRDLIAEDKVLLVLDPQGRQQPAIVRNAERAMFDLAAHIAVSLQRGESALVANALDRIADAGPPVPIAAVWELAVERRDAALEAFQLRALSLAGRVSLWLRHQFRGAGGLDDAERALMSADAVTRSISIWQATSPNGLDRLAVTCPASYIEKTTS